MSLAAIADESKTNNHTAKDKQHVTYLIKVPALRMQIIIRLRIQWKSIQTRNTSPKTGTKPDGIVNLFSANALGT
jgi:hypothetical protein